MGRSKTLARPGPLRKALFWVHLACGVSAGLIILAMSVTGVLLTYERQILAWAETSAAPPPTGSPRLSVDALLAAAVAGGPADGATPARQFDSVTIARADAAPVVFRAGRRERVWVDPFTGRPMADPAQRLRSFFAGVTAWHRWLAMEGDNRNTARAVTGASNLVFLFLAVSGLLLWLPQVWAWIWVRGRIWFRTSYATAKARDYNWHHVMGFWCAVPLVVITATASVFYYPWANDLVYLAAGDRPPLRSGPAEGRQAAAPVLAERAEVLSLQALLDAADAATDRWNSMTLSLPDAGADTVSVRVDHGNGGQPHLTETLTLHRISGEVTGRESFADRPAGARARSIVRFLHTGEVLGIIGQTVAGLASLAGAVLVWTGLALAYRRLLQPSVRRRRLVRQARGLVDGA